MTGTDDIHNIDARYLATLKRLEREVPSEANRRFLKDYVWYCKDKGVKKSSYTLSLIIGIKISKILQKDLNCITESDFHDLQTKLEENGVNDFNYRKFIKAFFNWQKGDNAPKWIKNIRLLVKTTPVQPSDLLTKEEVEKLLNCCTNTRDKALISVALDSGMRIGAIGTLRIKNVEFGKYGAVVYMSVTSRNQKTTAPQPFPLTWSTGYLNTWLDMHPAKNNREAPLWVSLHGDYKGNVMSYRGMVKHLDKIVKESGINKRVHFHLFRHQKVTDMILNKFSDQQIKFQAGWTPDSTRMFKIYGNFLDKEMVDSIYAHHGLKIENEQQVKLIQCPRCHVILVPGARVCHQCALIFDSKLAKEVQDHSEKIPSAVSLLMNDPDFMQKLNDLVKKAKE